MRLSFAISFLLGVAAAVYFLARGVERLPKGTESLSVDQFGRLSKAGRLALGAPILAAFLVVFGLAGYIAGQAGIQGSGTLVLTAGVAGSMASWLAVRAVARWARYAATHDAPDERYELQGHVATVVRAAEGTRDAEVEYYANGRRVVVPARGEGPAPLAVGAEVVIERLEMGVAFVESWTQVEERI